MLSFVGMLEKKNHFCVDWFTSTPGNAVHAWPKSHAKLKWFVNCCITMWIFARWNSLCQSFINMYAACDNNNYDRTVLAKIVLCGNYSITYIIHYEGCKKTVAEETRYLLIFGCFSFLVFDIPDKQGFVCLGNDLYLLIRRYAVWF